MGASKIMGTAAVLAGIIGFTLGALMQVSCDYDYYFEVYSGFCSLFLPSEAGGYLVSVFTAGLAWGPLLLFVGILVLVMPPQKATISP